MFVTTEVLQYFSMGLVLACACQDFFTNTVDLLKGKVLSQNKRVIQGSFSKMEEMILLLEWTVQYSVSLHTVIFKRQWVVNWTLNNNTSIEIGLPYPKHIIKV